MTTIRREIDVDEAPSVVAATWKRFIEWAHNGPSRLACDELACVDAVRAGLVSFTPSPTGRTTVVFAYEAEAGGPADDEVARHLGHDLVVFKDYVERSGHQVGKPTELEERAMVQAEDRHEHRPGKETLSERDESVAYTDHFPT